MEKVFTTSGEQFPAGRVKTCMGAKKTIAVATLFTLAAVACAAVVPPGDYVITGDVYFGSIHSFRKPCVLKRTSVFAEIQAVKTIKREKLEKDSARYAFLIQKANRVFRETVEKVAAEKGFHLVVEKGGIRAADGSRIPNITDSVIAALPK